MVVSVLVMTPVRSFGELIQQALQDVGVYRVTLVYDNAQALDRISSGGYPVAVLDFDLDPNPAELVTALYAADPGLRIIAMKDEAGVEKSVMGSLRLAKLLDTPFYLPDLLDELEAITASLPGRAGWEVETKIPSSFQSSHDDWKGSATLSQVPNWLYDVGRTAQYLTRLSVESEAQAALITRQAQLWAYAGLLPDPAAEELARFVAQYWKSDIGSDFARFIRLDATNREYMLYATGLGGGYILALTFEIEIPFSTIRAQAKDMAKRLVAIQEEPVSPGDLGGQQLKDPGLSPASKDPLAPHPVVESASEVNLAGSLPDWQVEDDLTAERLAFFEEILAAVDIPDPDGRSPLDEPRGAGSVGDEDAGAGLGFDNPDGEGKDQGLIQASNPESGSTKIENPFAGDLPAYLVDVTLEQGEGDASASQPDHLEDTRPTPVRQMEGKNQPFQNRAENQEAANPILYNLTYACVLVPRLPKHHLVGDLAAFLNECVVQLCLAFGWRLEYLAIRPEYLHWVVVIQPGISPSHMVGSFREQASKRIFMEFPLLAVENPSRDFWAPGYLIVKGNNPLSQGVVEDFIRQTRSRQGNPKIRSRFRHV